MANKQPEFDPSKIQRVSIDSVEPNEYNPKKKDTKEYRNVVDSIRINGLQQPIMVREVDGNDNFVIVDGEQRWTAAKELGYGEVYIYNFGKITEEEAKALTIWMEVQVPFNEIDLAPIVVELSDLNIELPYTEAQVEDFRNLAVFDFEDAYKDDTPVDDDGFKTLAIKMTAEQFDVVNDAIKTLSASENISEGRALELLCADGIQSYQSQNYISDNEK